jgi:hypothetical protein
MPDLFITNPLKTKFTNRKNNAEKGNREDNPEIGTVEKLEKEELSDREEVRKPHRSSESSGNPGIREKIEGIHSMRQP